MGRFRNWDPIVEGRAFPAGTKPEDLTVEDVIELTVALESFLREIEILAPPWPWPGRPRLDKVEASQRRVDALANQAPPRVMRVLLDSRELEDWDRERRNLIREARDQWKARNKRERALRRRKQELKARGQDGSDELENESRAQILRGIEETFALHKRTPAFQAAREARSGRAVVIEYIADRSVALDVVGPPGRPSGEAGGQPKCTTSKHPAEVAPLARRVAGRGRPA